MDGVTGPVLALAGGRDALRNASGQAAGLAATLTAYQVLQTPTPNTG